MAELNSLIGKFSHTTETWEGRVKACLPNKEKAIIVSRCFSLHKHPSLNELLSSSAEPFVAYLSQVLKIGTSSLLRAEQQTLNLSNLARICETVKVLHSMGHYVIMVTSGAVGVGCQRLGLSEKPTEVAKKQALAAVGQVHLMKYYEDFLSTLGLYCAQDTVAVTQEHRFGDNDTLSAQVAALVQADWLFLMTDVDCLYTANPHNNPDAQPIYEVPDISKLTADTSTEGTQWGTGGMATKLTAGRIATAAGCTMCICLSSEPENIVKILRGDEKIGTKFYPLQHKLKGRKRWIMSVPIRGTITMDDGAVKAVKDKRKSLFAAGITGVEGDFHVQDAVSLCDKNGVEFARGLTNFSAEEVNRTKGKRTRRDVAAEVGYHTMGEVVHRENLVLLANSEGQGDESEFD
eukprot:gene13420-19275_t